MHDREADPRPFATCLKEWQVKVNGGRAYGAREVAAAELRTRETTYAGWVAGRSCRHEGAIRRLMTLIDQAFGNDKSPASRS